jgi:hypothetical protein
VEELREGFSVKESNESNPIEWAELIVESATFLITGTSLTFGAVFCANLSFCCPPALPVCGLSLVKALLPFFLRFFISDGLPDDSPDASDGIRELDAFVPPVIKIGDGVSHFRGD